MRNEQTGPGKGDSECRGPGELTAVVSGRSKEGGAE